MCFSASHMFSTRHVLVAIRKCIVGISQQAIRPVDETITKATAQKFLKRITWTLPSAAPHAWINSGELNTWPEWKIPEHNFYMHSSDFLTDNMMENPSTSICRIMKIIKNTLFNMHTNILKTYSGALTLPLAIVAT